LIWLGDLEPELANRLGDSGWRVAQAPVDERVETVIGRVAAEVAVVDFVDGNDDRLERIEALLAAHNELQWLAVASERALSLPRVCELIHDRCFDFFIPPVRAQRLVGSLAHAWGRTRLLSSPRRSAAPPDCDLGLVGTSPAMCAVRERLCRFAGFDMPVLLTGETGTGKDVAARAIHARSTRRQGPFAAINCGALPENLVQSELFGHERGAFTGANARKIGRIEAAEGGVVFLDEIGDLPLEAQCNLLRFLEARTIERVGSNRSIRVDARVIAATHVDLESAVREGRFREDLYYRLNVLRVHLPPLRERGGDAEILARHFLEQFRRLHRTRASKFSAAACKAIAAYAWPGNVRELINRVHGTAVMADKRLLEPADLGIGATQAAAPSLHAAREHADRETIAENLRASGFNMSECARRLNISRITLYRLCRKYRLKAGSATLALAWFGMPADPDSCAVAQAAVFLDGAIRAAGSLLA
jgi:DNA-binding NtrC family response regulator